MAGVSGLEAVGGALGAIGAAPGDVGVDHGRLWVAVAPELLDGANVGAVLEEVDGEGVAESVADALRDARGALYGGFVQMMAEELPVLRSAVGLASPREIGRCGVVPSG